MLAARWQSGKSRVLRVWLRPMPQTIWRAPARSRTWQRAVCAIACQPAQHPQAQPSQLLEKDGRRTQHAVRRKRIAWNFSAPLPAVARIEPITVTRGDGVEHEQGPTQLHGLVLDRFEERGPDATAACASMHEHFRN